MVATRIGIGFGAFILLIGIAGVIAGICVATLLPSIVRQRVIDAVVLKPDGTSSKKWTEPPVVASMQFWMFNVTNPNEIIFQGAKPVLKQKGPYGFREQLQKRGVTFSSKNTVTFSAYKNYFFSPELSCETCSLDDVLTIPNIPYLTVMKLIRNQTAAKGILDFVGGILLRLVGEHPFVTDVTVRQILFEGYDDQIFKLVNQFKPGLLPEKMGLFYGRNGSEDGPYEIRSGADDISKLGEIITWQGHTDLNGLGWWNPNYSQASMINGTDGGIYAPFLTKDPIPIFARDICRSISVSYTSDVNIDGITAYRFRPSSEVFSLANKANKGFCWPSKERYYSDQVQPQMDGGWCLPAGMLDVTKCYTNAPLVMTSPQFVFCPDEVISSVDGLLPPSDEFITTIDMEPTTGVVISATKKLQINVEMYADASKPLVFQKMKPTILPILWLNESIAINDQTRAYLYDQVVSSQKAAYMGSYSAIGIGAALILIGLIVIVVLIVRIRRNAVGDAGKYAPSQHLDAAEVVIAT